MERSMPWLWYVRKASVIKLVEEETAQTMDTIGDQLVLA